MHRVVAGLEAGRDAHVGFHQEARWERVGPVGQRGDELVGMRLPDLPCDGVHEGETSTHSFRRWRTGRSSTRRRASSAWQSARAQVHVVVGHEGEVHRRRLQPTAGFLAIKVVRAVCATSATSSIGITGWDPRPRDSGFGTPDSGGVLQGLAVEGVVSRPAFASLPAATPEEVHLVPGEGAPLSPTREGPVAARQRCGA